MTVEFKLFGEDFVARNGGPMFKFTVAISFVVSCCPRRVVDYYWTKLTDGGGKPIQGGWLKDKCGLSWQIFRPRLWSSAAARIARATRVMQAMLQMVRLDIKRLKTAAKAK